MKYRHLSLEEREKLFAYRALGTSFRWIAKRLGRSHSTLVRELKRPKYGKTYLPCVAQREAQRIAFRQRQRAALKNPTIFLFVRTFTIKLIETYLYYVLHYKCTARLASYLIKFLFLLIVYHN